MRYRRYVRQSARESVMKSQPRADGGNTRVTGAQTRRYLAGGLVAGGVWFAALSTGPLQSQAVGRRCSIRTSPSRPSSPASPSRPAWRSSDATTSSCWRRLPERCSESSMGCCRPRRRWISPSTRIRNGACSGSRFTPASPEIPASICIGPRARRWTPPACATDTTDAANTPLLGNRVDSFIWNGQTLQVRTKPGPSARVSGRCRPAAPRKPQRRHHPVRGEPRSRRRSRSS